MLVLICLQALLACADVVTGRVVDAETGEPLPDAKIEFGVFPISEHYAWVIHLSADSCGRFCRKVDSMSKVSIKASYFAYETLEKYLNVAGGKDTLDLGDLKMKMSAELLDEVLVKAKARRFTMRGDTVIFNPEAFNLDDGERIATLLKKLPGVSVKDGKLFFMDKEVHLKMNGHDVADEMLTSLLPAQAVKDIKAYEKKSEQAQLNGMSDGQEQQVLDITIKPGFMDKWYGQTKLEAYASPNYRASANLHYLTDKDPLNVYVRASDCGSRTTYVWGNDDYQWINNIPQRQHFGKVSYKHNWKPSFVDSSSSESQWNIGASPNHNDTYQHSWTSSERYLSGEPSSFGKSSAYNYNHSLELPLDCHATLHVGRKSILFVDLSGRFTRNGSRNSSQQQTFRSETFSDDPQQMVNSVDQERLSKNDKGIINSNLRFIHSMKRSDLAFFVSTDYKKEKGSADSHADYVYHELGTRETLVREEKNDGNTLQTIADFSYSYQIVPEKVRVTMAYWMDYWRNESNASYLRNGEYDIANSYNYMKSYLVNEPRVEVHADLDKVWLHALVKMQNVYETMDYQRGKLDTLAHRSTWFPRPLLEFRWKNTKTSEIKGNVNWEYKVADLLGSMDYTDDTDPLNIKIGNPSLKASSILNARLSYNTMFVKGQQMLSLSLGYNRHFDPAAAMSVYNTQTGGYTSSQTNTDDRQRWTFEAQYDRSIGEHFRFLTRGKGAYSREYGIQTLTAADDPIQQFRRTQKEAGGVVTFSFSNKMWDASLWVRTDYKGLRYSDPTLNNQNLWDYDIGMRGVCKMKSWTFGLYTKLLGSAGYMSDLMNRNRFDIDADVTWKMLKDRGQLTLSARDILNQMADTGSYIDINTRTETKNETLHRYLSLSFTYNFDAKAKKDKK